MTKPQDPKAKAVSMRGNGYAEYVSISILKANPSNPRVIRDGKFTKLVRSLVRFPTMLEKRPIVHVERVVLGGNQRLRAIETILGDWKKAAAHLQGLPDRERGVAEAFWAEAVKHKALPASCIADASGWTDEQRREFIIKDNVGFGEWEWDSIEDEWNEALLEDWGMEDKRPSALKKTYDMLNGKFDGAKIEYPVTIILTPAEFREWKKMKKEIGSLEDNEAFWKITKGYIEELKKEAEK